MKTIRLRKDIDELFAGRRSLARSGNQTATISSLYFLRPLLEDDEPLLILFHAPKKNIPKAHERNKVKRWMREAVKQNEELSRIESALKEKNKQVLLLLRGDFKPSKEHSWQEIRSDINIIAGSLGKKT